MLMLALIHRTQFNCSLNISCILYTEPRKTNSNAQEYITLGIILTVSIIQLTIMYYGAFCLVLFFAGLQSSSVVTSFLF